MPDLMHFSKDKCITAALLRRFHCHIPGFLRLVTFGLESIISLEMPK